MLTPQVLRPAKRLRPYVICILIGTLLGMFVSVGFTELSRGPDARLQVTHSDPLQADLIGLRSDPYQGSQFVLGCLTHEPFCAAQWLPYGSIDEIAALSYGESFGACVPGCVFVNRGAGWTCEGHVIYLTLMRFLR